MKSSTPSFEVKAMRKKPIWLALSLLGLALGSCDPALPSSSSSSPGSSSETSKVETSSSDSEPVSVVSNELISESDGVRTYKIVFSDGTETVYSVKDGADEAKGPDGTYIVEVKKTGTDGNVDTYTIYLTNGTTFTFTVTNGTAAEPSDKVTVSFDANGGKLETTTIEVEKGSTTELPIPTRNGYTFLGWYTEKRIDSACYNNTTPISGDVTLIARWTPIGGDWTTVQSYWVSEMNSTYYSSLLSVEQTYEYEGEFNDFILRLMFASNDPEGSLIKEEFDAWFESLPVLDDIKTYVLTDYEEDLAAFESNAGLSPAYVDGFRAILDEGKAAQTIGELNAAKSRLSNASIFIRQVTNAQTNLEQGTAFYQTAKELLSSALSGYEGFPIDLRGFAEVFRNVFQKLGWNIFDTSALEGEFESALESHNSSGSLFEAVNRLSRYLCNYLTAYQESYYYLEGIGSIIQPFLNDYSDIPSSLPELRDAYFAMMEDFPLVLAEVEQYVGSLQTVTVILDYPFAPGVYPYGTSVFVGSGETIDLANQIYIFPGYELTGLYTDANCETLYNDGSYVIDENAPTLYVGYELVDESAAYDAIKQFGYDYFPMLEQWTVDERVESYRDQGLEAALEGLYQLANEHTDAVNNYFWDAYDQYQSESGNYPDIDASAELQTLDSLLGELGAYLDNGASDLPSFKELYASLTDALVNLAGLFIFDSLNDPNFDYSKQQSIELFENNFQALSIDYPCDVSGQYSAFHDFILARYEEASDYWQIDELGSIADSFLSLIGLSSSSYHDVLNAFIDGFHELNNRFSWEAMSDRFNQIIVSLEELRDGHYTPEEMFEAMYAAAESALSIYEDAQSAAGLDVSVRQVFPFESVLITSGSMVDSPIPAFGDFSAMEQYAIPGYEISGIYADEALTELISDDPIYEFGEILDKQTVYLTYELVDWKSAVPALQKAYEWLFGSAIDDLLEYGFATQEEVDSVVASLSSIESEQAYLAAVDEFESFHLKTMGRQMAAQVEYMVDQAAAIYCYAPEMAEIEYYANLFLTISSTEDFYAAQEATMNWFYAVYPSAN